jgi:hypothetical protein
MDLLSNLSSEDVIINDCRILLESATPNFSNKIELVIQKYLNPHKCGVLGDISSCAIDDASSTGI